MINLIMPYYNSKATIVRALSSIAAQTRAKKFILTIVDDGSDPDQDIQNEVNFFSTLFPITLYKIPHTGSPGLVRQYAIDRCTCDYIMFLDADDILLPRAGEVMAREALQNPSDFIVGYFYRETEKNDLELMNEQALTWLHGNLYRTQFLKDNNIKFFEWLNEDGGFNVQVAELSKSTRVLPEPMMIWTFNPNSITRSNKNFVISIAADYISTYTCAYESLVNQTNIEKYARDLGRRLGQFYSFCNEEMRKTGALSTKTSNAFERFLKDCAAWDVLKNPDYLYHACLFINNNTIFPDMCALTTLPDFLKMYGLTVDLQIGGKSSLVNPKNFARGSKAASSQENTNS